MIQRKRSKFLEASALAIADSSKYKDELEQKQILLWVVIEETEECVKIITAYKISKIRKYLSWHPVNENDIRT